MTIGKKLYGSFGIILIMVVVLFCVNWFAVQREHAAKSAAQASLELADTTNAVRFQMMQDRLYLSNYLLSGDTREVDRMNEGLRILNDKLEQGKSLADSEQEKTALSKVEQLEQSWGKEFAQPLIDKRKDVDSGNATVAELQIYYLQKDASSWVKNSTDALDVADGENRKLVEARRKSDETAATATIIISLLSTIVALVLGVMIAFRTAKSITQPLSDLMNVARQIGNTGDLEHSIDLKRDDEIGELLAQLRQDGHLSERNGIGFRIHRWRRSYGGGKAAFLARHSGPRLRPHGGRTGGAGAQRARRFVASGQRLQPGGRRLRRFRKSRVANLFRHRRSYQHHARDERQCAEHGEEHAGAGFECERNFGLHRPDGGFDPARS